MKFNFNFANNIIGLLPALVLLLCSGVTYHFWELAYQLDKKQQQELFDFRANEIEVVIKQRLQAYAQILHGGRALFLASEVVSRAEFKNYIAELHIEDFYPGIQGIGFAQLILPAEKQPHIAAVRAEGFSNYTIWPNGERETYSSIVYLEPFADRNLRAFGFDMYSESVRHAAMDWAWQKDEVAMSGKVTLVQETQNDRQAGFLMFLPLYRKESDLSSEFLRRINLLGWIYAPFRMNDFMQAVLRKRHNLQLDVDVDIYDGKQMSLKSLLYNRDNDVLSYTSSVFVTIKQIEFAGHVWSLNIHSHTEFERSIDLRRSYITVIIGTVIATLLTAVTWLLVNGRKRALVIAEQMTQQVQEREKLLKAITDNSNTIIFIKDLQGRFLFINKLFEKLFHVHNAAALGKSSYDFFPKEVAEKLIKDDKVVAELGQSLTIEENIPHDGVSHTYITVKFPLRNNVNEIYAICGIATDISKRKKMEEEIRQLSASELNKARLEAEKANLAKSEFLSRMSHELRTPLNAVLGFAQLLAEEHLTEEQQDHVQEILTAGQHLLDLINEILDLAKIESGKLAIQLEKLPLNALIKNCLILVQPLSVKHNIEIIDNITSASDFFIVADSLRFKQILLNLMSNAIKYNKQGGNIKLSCEPDYDEQRLLLHVADTGNGLLEEQLIKLFQPFERFAAKDSEIEGTGIGLCICKKLIEAMDGKILVKSIFGEGSCFSIEIPFVASEFKP